MTLVHRWLIRTDLGSAFDGINITVSLSEVLLGERLRDLSILKLNRLAISRRSSSPSAHAFRSRSSLTRGTSGAVFRRVNRVLCRGEYKLCKFHEAGSLLLLELEHKPDNFNDVVRVALLELGQSACNQSFTVVDLIALVESCDIFHGGALVEDQTAREHI